MSVYLLDTPASYYFRIKVPKALRSVIKKREIKLSLKTENRQRATRLAALYAFQWQEIFNRLRGYPMTDPLANCTWLKNSMFEKRADGSASFSAGEIDPENADGELKLIQGICNMLGIEPSQATIKVKPSYLLSQVVDDYCKAVGVHWTDKYRKSTYSSFRLTQMILGDKSIDEYSIDDRNNLLLTLKLIPASWYKKKVYLNKNIDEIIKIGGANTFSDRAINNHMNKMIWLFDWMIKEKSHNVDKNPFSGGKIPRTKIDSSERDMFTLDEVEVIFSDPIFTAHQFDIPSEYWLPLLGLYTGMRMGEIAQLELDDVFEQHGVLVLNITPEGTEIKSIKTLSSKRFVPVHPHIRDIGFDKYLQSMRSTPNNTRLFPDVPYKNDGYSYLPSKNFGKLLKRCGFQTRSGKTFHSFRHTVATSLDHTGSTETTIARLLGHVSANTMTGKRYIKDSTLKERYALVCQLSFSNYISNVKPWTKSIFAPKKAGRPKTEKIMIQPQMDSEETKSLNLFAKVFGRSAQAAGLTD